MIQTMLRESISANEFGPGGGVQIRCDTGDHAFMNAIIEPLLGDNRAPLR